MTRVLNQVNLQCQPVLLSMSIMRSCPPKHPTLSYFPPIGGYLKWIPENLLREKQMPVYAHQFEIHVQFEDIDFMRRRNRA